MMVALFAAIWMARIRILGVVGRHADVLPVGDRQDVALSFRLLGQSGLLGSGVPTASSVAA
jgi:hypothetical protein